MAKVLKRNLLRNKFCVKNWYHKLYSVYHVRFNSISKYRAIFCNFAIFFLFCGNADLSTFRSEYKALFGVKIFVWSIRNFWHPAMLCTRSGRYSNYRFSTSNQRFFCNFAIFSFFGNGDFGTFRYDYRALLGAKIFVWSRSNFWHQAVLCNRTGRYSNYRFSTSGSRFSGILRFSFILRKWQFEYLLQRVPGTAWCQNFRLIKTQLLAPSSAWYSLQKVLKLSIFCFQSEIFTNKNCKNVGFCH